MTWAAAAFTLALLAPAEPLAPTAGTVRFVRTANSAFDRYTKSPDPAQQKWMRAKYWRMLAYSPYFDSRLAWFPAAWAYKDLYGIATGAGPQGPPVEDLDAPLRVARQRVLASFERLYLLAQLRRFRGSIKETARHSGITTKHVRALMRRHGFDRRDFQPPVRLRSLARPKKNQAG